MCKININKGILNFYIFTRRTNAVISWCVAHYTRVCTESWKKCLTCPLSVSLMQNKGRVL